MFMKYILSAVVLALVIGNCQAIGIGFSQSAGVEGTLVCDGKPMSGVLVKLYDSDRGIDTDDKMAEGRTDSRGHFSISGHTREFSSIDPKFNIYHHCGDIIPRCARKHSVKIPDRYISKGKTPEKFFNAQTIELAGTPKGENRDCIH